MNTSPETIQSIAGAITGITLALTWAYFYIRKEEARKQATSDWIGYLYANLSNDEQRKRLLFTPRCELTPAEIRLLTPPAYRK